MIRRSLVTLSLMGALVQPAAAGPIDDLRPGEWYRVPNSKLEAVFPSPLPPGYGEAIMVAWSGGAYDSQRDRLIVWGGGHSDYAGNEIYAFDVNTLTWSRVTNPSTDVGGSESSGYYPDGKPRSRHTYDYVEYLPPPFDRFCSFGGHGLYPSGQIGIRNVDCFDFNSGQWRRYANTPSYGIGIASAYDPVRGHAWVHGYGSSGQLAEWDPIADTWTLHDSGAGDIYYANGVVDPVRRRFIAIGNGIHASWNIDAPGALTRTNLATSGAKSIESADNPGVDYDPVSDRIVAWSGGSNVYVLDLNTLVWTSVSPAPTNTVSPSAPSVNGTYGRFRYVPSKNVFVLVNSTDTDVYFYRLSAGGGSPGDTSAPASTQDLRTR